MEITGKMRFRFIKSLAVWLDLPNPFLINNLTGFFWGETIVSLNSTL